MPDLFVKYNRLQVNTIANRVSLDECRTSLTMYYPRRCSSLMHALQVMSIDLQENSVEND